MIRLRSIAVISLLFTIAFFLEYTPLWRRVHIPFDLEEFHYPLADYAFQALHNGRFPQWDPTIYSGLPFAGNIQSQLFYPPAWLMFGLSWGRAKLAYQAVENLALAHVWLAFLLCYGWLSQQKRLHPLAAALGSGVFAFGGYMMLQLQHLGLIAGYAWFPLGFWAIDAADSRGRWRPILGLTISSALCLLAGYPTTWAVFCICMLAYACARSGALRLGSWTLGALSGSLLLAAVQLAPAWEAARFMVPEAKYGRASGFKAPEFFLSYLIPNYFDFGLDVPVNTNPGKEYLYLGAAAMVGLVALTRRKSLSGTGGALAVGVVCLLFVVNPFGLIGLVVERSSLLSGLLNAWYFLAGLTASVALLAALGLDYALKRASVPVANWIATVIVSLSVAWSIRLLVRVASGADFAAGWPSGLGALASFILLGALVAAFPGSSPTARIGVTLAILTLAATEYKAFGTSKRFNAYRGPFSEEYVSKPFPNLSAAVYESLRLHPEYRIALDLTAPFPQKLRHSGLATPQGFDPFLPSQYKNLIDGLVGFRTNREFDLTPRNEEALRLLGVGYFMTSKDGPLLAELSANPRFRLLLPDDSYYKVFEFIGARPAFGWETGTAGQAADSKTWQPELRELLVRSLSGGRFRLSEQFYPGWSATVDGVTVSLERCHEAYQCVTLPAGIHVVKFQYRSDSLVAGAMISFVSLLLLAWIARR